MTSNASEYLSPQTIRTAPGNNSRPFRKIEWYNGANSIVICAYSCWQQSYIFADKDWLTDIHLWSGRKMEQKNVLKGFST